MFACLSMMTLYWPKLIHAGGSSVQPLHVGILLLIATSLITPKTLQSTVRMGAYCAPWLLAFLAYLLLFAFAAAGTAAMSKVPRQLLGVAGFLCIAGFCLRAADPARSLRRGALFGLLAFLALTEYSAWQIGKSLMTSVLDFLATGNIKTLIYKFFRPVFNAMESVDVSIKAAATNAIGTSIFVLAVCYRIGFRKPSFDLTGTAITLLAVFLLILLNARSVVVAAVLSMLLASLLGLTVRRGVSLTGILFVSVGLMLLAAFALVMAVRGESVVNAVATSFAFDDPSTESRLTQYQWAFSLIEESVLFGHGFLFTESGNAIHNLFLSAWAYVGLHGFLLALIFYLGIMASWVRWMYLVVSKRSYWALTLRAEWVAVLPILPLFRVWLSGDGGFLAFGEWIALAVFFGLVARNESVLRRQVRQRTVSCLESPLSAARYGVAARGGGTSSFIPR